MKHAMGAVAFAFALLAAGCATQGAQGSAASNGAAQMIPADPRVLHGTLANGFSYYIRENHKPEKRAELRLVVNAGSLQEEDNQQGLAHFLEHMAFNGTADFPKQKIIDYLESIGMGFGPDLNASTGFDETIYKLQIPTDDPQAVETGIRILEQWAHGMSLDPTEVDRERPVIVEEWRVRRGADARMQETQYPILFRDSRYALRLPIGKMEIVQKARAEDLGRFYRDWYRPDLMAVVAVGDFDPALIEKLVRDRFSAIPAPEHPRPRHVFPVPDNRGTLYAPATDPEASLTRVSLYVKRAAVSQTTVADFRREIVRQMYSDMLDARLEEITKKPGAPITEGGSGWARIVRSKEVYILTARVREDRITEALGVLLTESERVRRYGFTATELEREKKALQAEVQQYYNDRENRESPSLVRPFIDNYLSGDAIPAVETEYGLYGRFLPEINLEEVNRLANGLLTDDNRVVMVNAPQSQAAAVPSEAQVEGIFRQAAAAPLAPYEDRVAGTSLFGGSLPETDINARSEVPALGLTEWRLANGVTVDLKPTDFKKDEVLFAAFSAGGTSVVPDSQYIAAVTASTIVAQSGVGDLDATQLTKMLAGKTASVTPWIGELQQGLRGSARPEDLETLFQLAYLYLTRPRADLEAFQVYRQRLKTNLLNRRNSPQAVFYDTLQDLLAQNNPRGSSWHLENVDQMDLDTSLRVYRERFRDAGGLRFAFVGSFTLPMIEPLVRKYLGALPSEGRGESWKDTGVVPPEGVVSREVKKGLEPQSRVEIVFHGTTAWSLENRLQVDALGRILDIRLRETVREKAGGSYDVGVDGQLDHYPRPQYMVSIDFGCAPEKVDALIALAMQEVQRVRDKGPESVDVEKVTEMLRREHEKNMGTNEYWLGSLQVVYANDLDPREILGFDKRLQSVTSDAIRQKARELLREDSLIRLVLYPEGAPVKK